MSIKIEDLTDEYGLELSDIRWYLSIEMSRRLVSYADEPNELADLIWRGSLGDELYDMEERYLRDTQDLLDRGLMDEAQIRNRLSEALRARRLRRD